MGQKIRLWQPYRDEELKRQKWSYWDLWQGTPFMTTKQNDSVRCELEWMHTRQDRWIQTELVFTLAKNATKPNNFEIISLQTTRKKNNWKTEETLARTVVTLETERIKGSNPWCLCDEVLAVTEWCRVWPAPTSIESLSTVLYKCHAHRSYIKVTGVFMVVHKQVQ